MADYLKRSWAVVNLDALAHNIRTLQERLAPGCRMMGVVKADAYGHGDKFVADQMVRLGINWFGVSNLEEAVSLRMQGIFHPILIFGVTPPEHVPTLNEYNLTQAVFSPEYAEQLHAVALKRDLDLQVHIKVDTGMSRLGFVACNGFAPAAVEQIAAVCRGMPRLHAEGIFTHFACADEAAEDSRAYTRKQFACFQEVLEKLEEQGIRFHIRHCCNSGATMQYPEMHLDMVRPGIAVYGLAPSPDCAGLLDLHPVMELYSTIAQVKRIPAGTPVSYGRIWTSKEDTVVASVAIGYADGYARNLSNRACALVRGEHAGVMGRVCMDQMMLDVTHIPEVKPGDVVTLVGTDGGKTLTFEEMARLSDTIAYEKVCLIGRRVPRIYRRGGRDINVVDYVRHSSDVMRSEYRTGRDR